MSAIALTQPRVITSELIKLRTLRSSWITMGAAFVIEIGLGLLICAAEYSHFNRVDRKDFNPTNLSLVGVHLAQLAIVTLGVLFASGEYSTGMIRATFSAVPKRLPVVWAKAVVFGGVTFVTTLVGAFIAFLGGQALLHEHGTDLSGAHVPRAIFGVAIYLMLIAIIASAVGFILRSTAGGITGLIALLLVIPGILAALPQSWHDAIDPYLPSSAGGAFYDLQPDSDWLSPLGGLAVLIVWAAVSTGVAALLVRRRDA